MASSGKVFNHIKATLPSHKSTVIEYDSSQSIEKSLDSIIEQLPRKIPFSIISHSLGGIMGYLMALRYEVQIQKFVSISTPFGGSEAASKLKWFYPQFSVLRDITSSSKIIKEIASSQLEDIDQLAIISTGGQMSFIKEPNDGVVTIKSQKSLTSPIFVEIPANHFEIVQDPLTIDHIKKFIF